MTVVQKHSNSDRNVSMLEVCNISMSAISRLSVPALTSLESR